MNLLFCSRLIAIFDVVFASVQYTPARQKTNEFVVLLSTYAYICTMLKNIILVAAGGAAGSVVRYLMSRVVNGLVAVSFPSGTMFVNVAGCLFIGFVYGLCAGKCRMDGNMSLLLTTGFCGGFTTFSTFASESLELFRSGSVIAGALYAGVSVALGLAAVALGMQITKMI